MQLLYMYIFMVEKKIFKIPFQLYSRDHQTVSGIYFNSKMKIYFNMYLIGTTYTFWTLAIRHSKLGSSEDLNIIIPIQDFPTL